MIGYQKQYVYKNKVASTVVQKNELSELSSVMAVWDPQLADGLALVGLHDRINMSANHLVDLLDGTGGIDSHPGAVLEGLEVVSHLGLKRQRLVTLLAVAAGRALRGVLRRQI